MRNISQYFDKTVRIILKLSRHISQFCYRVNKLNIAQDVLHKRKSTRNANEHIARQRELDDLTPNFSFRNDLSFLFKTWSPSRCLTYADDTQLYLSFKPNSDVDQHDAITAMEQCVKAIRNWMLAEKLSLNDDKTEFLIIGTRQ